MPPKKKGKKGKKDKKPKETDQLTAVDKTFYELTITDLNNKLARLRTHCAKLETTSEELTEKLRVMEEDRTDITAFLQRKLEEKSDTIIEMDEHLMELAKVRDEENKAAVDKIKELESKYKAMHDQLTSEIKLLNGKLNSLEEFRIQRADLLMKFDEQEDEMKELKHKQEEKIRDMERNAIIEKDRLKKEVEAKLLQLSEDFTKSSEIRIAGYTRRLIRENVALNKEMDKMVGSQVRMEDETKQMKERNKEIEEIYSNSAIVKERLVKTCQNQIKIIEDLTSKYEILWSMYQKIIHYKKLYETSLKKDVCDQFSYNEMNKKLRILAQRIEKLKSDKQKLIAFHQKHEMEIIRLNEILNKIKFTVQSAINGEVDYADEPEFQEAQRQTLLHEVMQIMTTYTEDAVFMPPVSSKHQISSVYRQGLAGFTPKTAISLFDLFKREVRKIAAAELISPALRLRTSYRKITPMERPLESDTLFDAEIGTTLAFSASTEDEVSADRLDSEKGDIGPSRSVDTASKTGEEGIKAITGGEKTLRESPATGVDEEDDEIFFF